MVVWVRMTPTYFVLKRSSCSCSILIDLLPYCRNRLAFGLQTTHNTLGNLQLVSQYLAVLGNLGLALRDTVQAREILRSSLTLAKKLNDIPTQIWVLSNLTGFTLLLIYFM